MSKEESIIPSIESVFKQYIDTIPSATLSSELVGDILKALKDYGELVRDKTLEVASKKAGTKAYYREKGKNKKYKEWDKGDSINIVDTIQMYKVDKDSILDLKQSETLKIS